MAIRMYLPGLLCFLILGSSGPAFSSDVRGGHPLRNGYLAEIGVRESTDNNDGQRVSEYLRYCGLPEGYEWCAAFVSWCFGQAGYTEPRNAWAAALFPKDRTIWSKDKGLRSKEAPAAGDVFGIYIPSKKRIGHCGFVDGWDGKWCFTVEGNVDNAVVRKRRLVSTIHAVANWQTGNPSRTPTN